MADRPPQIFDRHALARVQARAARIAGDLFLAREAAEGVGIRIAPANRRFARAAEIGASASIFPALTPLAGTWSRVPIKPDEDLRLAPDSFDLIASVLALHSVNDLPGLLIQIRRALKPDGLFVGALFGGATLMELRDALTAAEIETHGGASPRIFPLADVRDLGGLLQRAGFALPVADVERTIVRYRDVTALVRDLRAHGETNILTSRSRRPLTRATHAAASAHYAKHHAEPDGRIRATFEIVYLTGWAPHESQQKPLNPGSARHRLADALNTREQSAGERTPIRPRSGE